MTRRLPIPKIIQLDRVISWLLVLVAVLTIYSGYAMSRHIIDRTLILPVHLTGEISFIALLITHIILSLLIPMHWRNLWQKLYRGSFTTANWLKLVQRLSGYALIFLAGAVILTGLDWYSLGIRDLLPFLQHIRYDFFMILAIILHSMIGLHFALKRRKIKGPIVTASILSVLVLSSLFIGIWDSSGLLGPATLDSGGGELPGSDDGLLNNEDDDGELPGENPNDPPLNETIPDPPQNTKPVLEGSIRILQTSFTFNPTRVLSKRPDIFNRGYFSMFDILAHLDDNEVIPMEYHFDVEMNTYVIDSLYGQSNWWYESKYEGGWSERNNFRMDHYPWKDGASLYLFIESIGTLNAYYREFREEVQRFEKNNEQTIIPEITLRGLTTQKTFTNVIITPHHLRNDMFKIGTITAIDVILSLAAQNEITYEIEWIEEIYGINIQNYWVQGIDKDIASGRCGWVYESGYLGLSGNHIHLPTDIRVLNSPEYVLFFWICI